MQIIVHPVPATLRQKDLPEACAVVIDALRMTSVAATAMANGCVGIYAVAEIEEAERLRSLYGTLTGGERGARQIPGFDFANSPLEYTAERVQGRRLVMTTSNGTQAILAVKAAGRVLLGAFVNAAAVADALQGESMVQILCAGTLGTFTMEDALAAGSIIARCLRRYEGIELDDMALAAHRLYLPARADIGAAIRGTSHARRLCALGLSADLAYCLREDVLQAVPQRDEDGWFVASRRTEGERVVCGHGK